MRNSPKKEATCDFCDPHGSAMRGLQVGNLSGILPPRTWPCGGGGHAQERGVGVSEISCHGSVYIRSMTLSVSRTVSLSFSQAFVHPRTHPLTNHSPTHSILHSLTLFLSLSLSGVYVRAFVRVPLSFVLSLSPLHSLSGFLSVSFFFFYTYICAHAVTRSLSHPLTHKRTHAPNLYPHLSCTLTRKEVIREGGGILAETGNRNRNKGKQHLFPNVPETRSGNTKGKPIAGI
jgi:hypothetical protein